MALDLDSFKTFADLGLGGLSFALFLRLGKVIANHEVRITVLEKHDKSKLVPAKRRRRR